MSNCVYFVLVLFVSSVRKQNKHLTRTVCTQHRSARRALSQSIDAQILLLFSISSSSLVSSSSVPELIDGGSGIESFDTCCEISTVVDARLSGTLPPFARRRQRRTA